MDKKFAEDAWVPTIFAVVALSISYSADAGKVLTLSDFPLPRLPRQQNSHASPLALFALHRDGAEMGLDNALDDGKA